MTDKPKTKVLPVFVVENEISDSLVRKQHWHAASGFRGVEPLH